MNVGVIPLFGLRVGTLEIEAGEYGSHNCSPTGSRCAHPINHADAAPPNDRPPKSFRLGYGVVHPPLGLITWPIMNLESSEARKSAAAAISRGSPKRPIGVLL